MSIKEWQVYILEIYVITNVLSLCTNKYYIFYFCWIINCNSWSNYRTFTVTYYRYFLCTVDFWLRNENIYSFICIMNEIIDCSISPYILICNGKVSTYSSLVV